MDSKFVAEMMGTGLLVLLGDGVVAAVLPRPGEQHDERGPEHPVPQEQACDVRRGQPGGVGGEERLRRRGLQAEGHDGQTHGEADGAGTTLNFPFPAGTRGDVYRRAVDEVIVPAHTFVATWLAVLAVGATPVACEPDPGLFNMLHHARNDDLFAIAQRIDIAFNGITQILVDQHR